MGKRVSPSLWSKTIGRVVGAITRSAVRSGGTALKAAVKKARKARQPPTGIGDWISGLAVGTGGMRRFKLYKPSGVLPGERLPLLVMLHGCGQDAASFAKSTRMNRIAERERFLVLYPEQDRSANPQGCWNWFSTQSGMAYAEAALIVAAIDQVCLLYPADPKRVAIAGLSAGASMGALLVTRHPGRFRAVVMHSGVPPGAADSTMSAIGAMQGRGEPLAAESRQSPPVPWPPLLVIHGAADRVVAASNGHSAAGLWAQAEGATAGTSRRVRRGSRYPSTWTEYKVRGRAIATLCEVDELAHAWSGGDPRHPFSDADGPDASRMTWSFFSKQMN